MIQTNPVLGNGVGTFKVIYPAYRRPQIIALEARSNTETDHSEDEYLETWQDEGIVGFGVLIWLIVTALVCGFKQLRWYSESRAPDPTHKRKMMEIEGDPRSYEVLGLLGAYIGALMHWFVDVSIRFVSSGIFSGLLPGALLAYARNHDEPVLAEPLLDYERWIRIAVAAMWTVVLLWLNVELVPQSMIQGGYTPPGQIKFWILLTGAGLYALIELLEIGNKQETDVRFTDHYKDVNPAAFPARAILIPIVAAASIYGIGYFGNQFFADVHHNLAIFFSKESIWTKSPIYESKIMSLPPDIREKYQNTGGALEHYKEVVQKNHAFPMALYFTGNVYNDWGSQVNGESMAARSKGDMEEAQRLKQKAIDMWDKAESAYNDTKKLAPNYVQTHHQMGLLYVKRAEQAAAWGDQALAQKYYDDALANFYKYKMLDPVFPPNYDRIVQILLMRGKIDESIALYKEAIYYNDEVARSIHNRPFSDRLAPLYVSLAKLYYNQIANKPNAFNPPAPQVQEAIKYFRLATESDPKLLEAWKGLGFLLDKSGQHQEAQAAYRQAVSIAPGDPDLKYK
jgi:tetratricopeptide (TPR) repeat protein